MQIHALAHTLTHEQMYVILCAQGDECVRAHVYAKRNVGKKSNHMDRKLRDKRASETQRWKQNGGRERWRDKLSQRCVFQGAFYLNWSRSTWNENHLVQDNTDKIIWRDQIHTLDKQMRSSMTGGCRMMNWTNWFEFKYTRLRADSSVAFVNQTATLERTNAGSHWPTQCFQYEIFDYLQKVLLIRSAKSMRLPLPPTFYCKS